MLGCLAGIQAAYCVQSIFSIGADLHLLLWTAKNSPQTLQNLKYGAECGVAFFFTSFNVAHWAFAMRYWGLALRLLTLVDRLNIKTVTQVIKIVTWSGYCINTLSGVLIILAIQFYGNRVFTIGTEVFNIMPAIISACFLLDSLRRLKQVAKGVLQIEVW